jgi:putative iron-dependent peroxidase
VVALPVESQPVLAPITASAVFLVLRIEQGGEQGARDVLENLAGLVRSVGFRVPDGRLSCVAGIGSEAWDRLFSGPRPAELHPFEQLVGPRHTAPATPGDLLFHIRSRRMDQSFELASHLVKQLGDAASVLDEVHGFKYFDERDLLGFVDGTENPGGLAAIAAALITEDQDPDFVGGSYVIVQKYVHDLDAWNRLTVEEQERVIGRSKLEDIETPDELKAADSHLKLNTIEQDGVQRQIVRDNMPFGRVGVGEFGTYYIGYCRTPSVTEQMLRNMFLGDPPGVTDRILDFSTAETGCLFFVPTADFLDDLPPLPGAAEEQAQPSAAAPAIPTSIPAAGASPENDPDCAAGVLGDGSLGIGSLNRSAAP